MLGQVGNQVDMEPADLVGKGVVGQASFRQVALVGREPVGQASFRRADHVVQVVRVVLGSTS